jgi:hypothetical protein
MTRTIARVLTYAATDAGHAVEVEVEFSDATRERLRCEEHVAPGLVQALLQASALAEKERATGQTQTVQVEMPYRATGLTIGVAPDTSELALKFSTAEGVPIVIAMAPDFARQALQKVVAQLKRMHGSERYRKH